jgi:hypothetical protein
MAAKRKVEVFNAGCGVREGAIEIIKRVAGSTCEVIVHNMKDIDTQGAPRRLASAPSPRLRPVEHCGKKRVGPC